MNNKIVRTASKAIIRPSHELSGNRHNTRESQLYGNVAERFKALVSKTGGGFILPASSNLAVSFRNDRRMNL